jgi:hypothetical protein
MKTQIWTLNGQTVIAGFNAAMGAWSCSIAGETRSFTAFSKMIRWIETKTGVKFPF